MEDDGWQVPNRRYKKRREKRAERRELFEKCPKPILSQEAHHLQHFLNIDCLADTLLSEEAKKLQLDGWVYHMVLKPEDDHVNENAFEYKYIENFNKWNDKIVFRRERQN